MSEKRGFSTDDIAYVVKVLLFMIGVVGVSYLILERFGGYLAIGWWIVLGLFLGLGALVLFVMSIVGAILLIVWKEEKLGNKINPIYSEVIEYPMAFFVGCLYLVVGILTIVFIVKEFVVVKEVFNAVTDPNNEGNHT